MITSSPSWKYSTGLTRGCPERAPVVVSSAVGSTMPLLSRPPMGNYAESELRGFYYSHDSIKLTRHCMPPGTTEQTEVENAPFTAYSKSTAFTFLEMAISFAYSAHGVTLNLFDHCGTPMQADPSMGQMLGDRKAFLTGLAKVSQLEGKFRGVRLLHHDDASRAKQLESPPQYASLYEEGQEMMQALEAMGIPTTYDESNVTAACGQVLRAFGDREIRELLCGSLLLDAPAACVLAERGFASVAAPGFEAASVVVVHTDDPGLKSGAKFVTAGLQAAGGVPLILNNTSDARVVTNNVALAAGWHTLELRYAQGVGSVGPQGGFRNGIMYDAGNGGFTNAAELARARMFTDDGGPDLVTDGPENVLSGMLVLAQDGTLTAPAAAGSLVMACGVSTLTAGSPEPVLTVDNGGLPLCFGSTGVWPSLLDAKVASAGGLVLTNRIWLRRLPETPYTIAAGADLALDGTALL